MCLDTFIWLEKFNLTEINHDIRLRLGFSQNGNRDGAQWKCLRFQSNILQSGSFPVITGRLEFNESGYFSNGPNFSRNIFASNSIGRRNIGHCGLHGGDPSDRIVADFKFKTQCPPIVELYVMTVFQIDSSDEICDPQIQDEPIKCAVTCYPICEAETIIFFTFIEIKLFRWGPILFVMSYSVY